jgi:hypothetical protein
VAGFGVVMGNSYASLTELKSILGTSSTTDDVIMRKTLESASRRIDRYCRRHFYITSETKYLDGKLSLWIPDLLSITTIKTDEDGDATFENTLDSDDYLLYGPGIEDTLNTYPKTRLEINPNGDYSSFASGVKKGVEIVGTWGYAESTTPYFTTAITGTVSTTTGTTLTLSADSVIEIGHTILCESEQMYVTALGTLSATVERGANGTTAAIHSLKALSYYVYPRDITQSCIDLAVALYQNRDRQGLQSERIGDYSYVLGGTSSGKGMIESILDDNIRSYKRMRF